MQKSLFANGCAYVDGKYLPIAEASIPILDTGFTRSDLTYDVVSVWNGKFFRLDDHLNRFENGWKRLRKRLATAADDTRINDGGDAGNPVRMRSPLRPAQCLC